MATKSDIAQTALSVFFRKLNGYEDRVTMGTFSPTILLDLL